MKKITRLILMIVFIMSTVHCNNNIDEIEASGHSVNSIEAMKPSGSGRPYERNANPYTPEEKRLLQQKLIGVYEGFLNNEAIIISIISDNTAIIGPGFSTKRVRYTLDFGDPTRVSNNITLQLNIPESAEDMENVPRIFKIYTQKRIYVNSLHSIGGVNLRKI